MITLTLATIAALVLANLTLDAYQASETAFASFLSHFDACEGEGRTSVADHGNPCV